MMVYIGWGVTYWHSIYGDLILGRAGVYLEGYVLAYVYFNGKNKF
jgi:hypothetical protein